MQESSAFYQIQTKFRDEIRPRFGVMRAREFLMKDAYSFNLDEASLKESYRLMHDTYTRVFDRTGLNYRAVLADSGEIGGSISHEFHVLAESGEDSIAYSDTSDYAANIEQAEAIEPTESRPAPSANREKVLTPKTKTIAEVSQLLNLPASKLLKTLVVKGVDDQLVVILLRGDHELNGIKVAKHPLIASPLQFATDTEIQQQFNCPPGFLGPIGIELPIIADRGTKKLADFVCGANENDHHYVNVNWDRDLPEAEFFDCRNVREGDASPDGQGHLKICRGIEVGHIFQLGDKYSKPMHAEVLDQQGKRVPLLMGCYGMGLSRIIAAAIEQNHDERGIIWPEAIAPFQIALIPINLKKSQRLRDACESVYHQLTEQGYDIIFDDRDERPGVMFADTDLIGLPHRLVMSEKGLDAGTIEYKNRQESDTLHVQNNELLNFLSEKVKKSS